MTETAQAMRDRTAVSGVGLLLGKYPERTSLSLAVEAYDIALADAGLERKDVDGIIQLSYGYDYDRFLEEVHSFEFWFEAVSGYLTGLTWGHRPGLVDRPRTPEERERLVTVLCNYCVGEAAALEGASGLVAIAPALPTATKRPLPKAIALSPSARPTS